MRGKGKGGKVEESKGGKGNPTPAISPRGEMAKGLGFKGSRVQGFGWVHGVLVLADP